jgi:Na+/melibiose symporter-like transporter
LWTVLQSTISPLWYYATKSINGMVHWMVLALTIVTDCLEEEQRATGVGLLWAGFWLGLCIGPTMAMGWSSSYHHHHHHHTVVVVMLSCLCQGLGLAVAIGWIPETLSPPTATAALHKQQHLRQEEPQSMMVQQPNIKEQNKRIIRWSRWIRFWMIRPIRQLAILNRNQILRLLALLAFFSGMATSGDQTLLLYYVDSVLHFDGTDIAIMFLLVGVTTVVAQTILLPPLHQGLGDRGLLLLCFGTAVFSNILYGQAKDRHVMYIAVCIGALSSMAFPTISAMKANIVESSERGRIQGALYSIQAVAAGIGPMTMRMIDNAIPQHHHQQEEEHRSPRSEGCMFFFAAFLQCIALVGAFHLPRNKYTNNNNNKNNSPNVTMAGST